MAVGPRDGFMDANCHATKQLSATIASGIDAHVDSIGSPVPNCSSVPAGTGTGTNTPPVSLAPSMDDTAKMGQVRQQRTRQGIHEDATILLDRWNAAAHLAQQMQQLELPLKPRSHMRMSDPASSSRPLLVSLPPSLATRQQRPTQTQPDSDVPMMLGNFQASISPSPPAANNVKFRQCATMTAWPPFEHSSSRLLMAHHNKKSHQLPSLTSNLSYATSYGTQLPPIPAPIPIYPGLAQPAFNYESGMAGLEDQGVPPPRVLSDEVIMEDDDDELLDDASLDMLVSTLARETARIEAARASHFHSRDASKAGEDDDDLDEDYDHADNQRSEFDYGDDDSSGMSSNPSTPSTSNSSSSRIVRNKGNIKTNGKTKAKRVRRACIVPGCGKRSRSLGLCIAHGGGRRCIIPGCDKSSQGGNHCIKHGGGKRCSVDDCDKAAQTNSLCKAHGGGPRCQFEDCEKSSQGGGYCRQHGGGKRCAHAGCMKGTQRGSYCALHGGSRLCIIDGCKRNDRGGGYCAHHGGGKRCTIAMCSRPSRRNGLCSTHLRLLGKDGHNLDDLNDSIDLGIRRNMACSPSSSPSPSPSPPM